MSTPSSPSGDPAAITVGASDWLARRDRGLGPREQDEFFQWLAADPRHRAELQRLEQTWGHLDLLAEWRPAHSTKPNPDLLAQGRPIRRHARLWVLGTAAALAACLALGVFLVRRPDDSLPSMSAGVRVIPAPERVVLDDGSVVEANRGALFTPAFTAGERRVRLAEGEAHFTVAPNPSRPFVVEVGGVAVRAVGTAFNVRRAAQVIDVIVTEGKVQLETTLDGGKGTAASAPTPVVAGEQATFDSGQPTAAATVVALTPAQIQRALAWQGVRLDFDGLPLAAVVAEFNLRNRRQFIIGDSSIGGLRVAGSFRADNVEGFARLLEASFGVVAESRADGTLVLRRAR
ncbi:MAG: FecR domain-containing protein [Verrucomicrobia bacterium]|nr:FecR domain-containing protein [Verrucomicrobiota bacterium]